MGLVTGLALATDLTFAITAGFAKGLRFVMVVMGLAFATDLRFAPGLDLVSGLRLAGRVTFLAPGNRRRGFRLAPGAADLVLLADDARFMG